METQHMTQQVFAEFLGIAPATLSSIFTGRTRPTLQVVEAIKNRIPAISTDWLMFGSGEMCAAEGVDGSAPPSVSSPGASSEQVLVFEDAPTSRPVVQASQSAVPSAYTDSMQMVKNFDKHQRKITEIRIFYDDQTWETFVSKK